MPKWQYRLGLIGKRLDYSFSPAYFSELFTQLGLSSKYTYATWPKHNEDEVVEFLKTRNFDGCNVTIPYKGIAAQCCDVLVGFASRTSAVNTIHQKDGLLVGFNTDVFGVLKTLEHCFAEDLNSGTALQSLIPRNVLVLGTGGAARAVQAACQYYGWSVTSVSRDSARAAVTYTSLRGKNHLSEFNVIVNTTPVGMTDLVNEAPDIQYDQISSKHLAFDLIYNPKKSLFLKFAEDSGAQIVNGEQMLREQANLAWQIWKPGT